MGVFMTHRRRVGFAILLTTVLLSSASWATSRPDASIFNPSPDVSRYLNTRQAENLRQWKPAGGFFLDYGNAPIKVVDLTTGSTQKIVGSTYTAHVTGAIGLTDWVQIGLDVPVLMYETFSNPNAGAVTGGPTEKYAGKLGDIKMEAQFQLLDINRYNVGVALAPFAQFPTGKKSIFFSNEQMSGGIRAIIEGKIKNRAYFAGNFGYQYLQRNQYFAGSTDAFIGSLFLFGVGGHVNVGKGFSIIGEGTGETVLSNFFKAATQTPITLLGGARYTVENGAAQGLQFTLAGGSGITKGVGAPKGEAVLSIAYRRPNVVRLPELTPSNVDARADEKILITQKIHFEFNRSIIRPISYPILDDVVQLLKLNPQIKRVQVEGHTDAIGGDAYNQRLSESRAKAVVAYLVSKGVASDRLTAIGYGRSRPIADNSTAEGRAKNRRTEFTVLE
jgi:outer membrane protein OmpA-like peptidoglycan-associated protein